MVPTGQMDAPRSGVPSPSGGLMDGHPAAAVPAAPQAPAREPAVVAPPAARQRRQGLGIPHRGGRQTWTLRGRQTRRGA
ncbi:hypothetical protein PAHAL_7G026000 [Panicum hallii]|uniref:Uncharacterized protein n=1 Tax=Panicum hallii TaxID=206008 RepID=A0A2T8IAT4_9POAL|nr:hypothetical protein PAHAL_7G026000 [Panicum hallii]